MDLHLTSAVATVEERAAVDALLGTARDRVGRWRPRRRCRDAVRARGPSRSGAAGPAAPRAARVAVRRRMDQRGRPELRVPAIDRPAGGGVRRGDVLRDVQRRTAAEDGRPRLRRPRVPARRRRACAPSWSAPSVRPSTGGAEGAAATWVRSPCLGMCERAPGGPGPAGGTGAAGRGVRSMRRGAGPAACSTGAAHEPEFARPTDPRGRRRRPRPGTPRAGPACGCCGASAWWTRRRSTTTGRTAGTRRCGARTSSGPEGTIREITDAQLMGRGGAAFPTGVKWKAVAEQPVHAALLHLQRRRIRARHVQGPGRDGAGSVRGDRGAHDRRLRHGMRAGLHLHPRRVPARDGAPGPRDRRGAPARVPRATT